MRLLLLTLGFSLLGTAALADCTSPAGPAGRIDYFATENVFKYCDGTNWNFWAGQTVAGGAPPTGGGPAGALNDLTDVDTTGKSNDDVLTWDGSSWVAQTPAGGGGGGLASVQVFTSGGTWNRPAGVTMVIVEVVGGGGGGGAACCAFGTTSGGGGGYAEKLVDVSAISSETATVGSGGSGCTCTTPNCGCTGGNGDTSSFGAHVSATGGNGGTSFTSPGTSGGAGGNGINGDINIKGEQARPSANGTYGGRSYLSRASASFGEDGVGYGGGGGPMSGGTSGDGAAGVVIVWEYE